MKHRLFVAISPYASSQDEIIRLQRQLDSLSLPIDWQPREKLHLTLNFLGSQVEAFIPNLKNILHQVAGVNYKFSLTPVFLETMYQKHGSSYLYLAPDNSAGRLLKDLQSQISAQLAAREIPQPVRFLPHLTIGHLKKTDPTATKKYLDRISEFAFHPLSPFEVDRITLYESFLSRAGSTFRILDQFRLLPGE